MYTFLPFFWNNCTIGHWNWPKLQITLCGTKSSWRILVVNYNYESFPKTHFSSTKLTESFSLPRHINSEITSKYHFYYNLLTDFVYLVDENRFSEWFVIIVPYEVIHNLGQSQKSVIQLSNFFFFFKKKFVKMKELVRI
jgi:hypothetical protein